MPSFDDLRLEERIRKYIDLSIALLMRNVRLFVYRRPDSIRILLR